MKHRFTIFFETKIFLRIAKKLLNPSESKKLKEHLLENPYGGDIIPGSGGIRKVRWARPGMGKRGGLRIVYYLIDKRGMIVLLTLYAKNDQSDLTPSEVGELAQAVDCLTRQIEEQDNG